MGTAPLIRRMREEDGPAVVRIQRVSPEAARWTPAGYMVFEAFVVEVAGEIAGFLVMRATAPDEAEILNLAVAPAWQRRGLARMLLERVAFSPPRALFLEVRESNSTARALYAAMGFAECGRRPGYYREPDEAAIVMRRGG
ncbi:MAG: GNAT family N-acetyltransferase [Bryobacteraceae bacterium]|nr:GNAT family N-acetyltransferase [Bryobacteraceae bacterium]